MIQIPKQAQVQTSDEDRNSPLPAHAPISTQIICSADHNLPPQSRQKVSLGALVKGLVQQRALGRGNGRRRFLKCGAAMTAAFAGTRMLSMSDASADHHQQPASYPELFSQVSKEFPMSNQSASKPRALIDNSAGNYKILPSGAAYCAGIVPDPGFEVVRAELQPWLTLEQGFAFIESHLKSIGRPVQAFCGIELRIPEPLTFDKWSSFNLPYLAQLRKLGLLSGDYSLVCRSNIALDLYPPATTSTCAFSYTVPASSKGLTFLLSGQADIGPNSKIIAEGEVGPQAMQKRTRFTIDAVGDTLQKLGFSWKDTTRVALFHVHDIPDLWGAALLGAIGEPVRRGVLTYRARPPIAGAEVELEARAIRQELVVATS